MRLLPASWLLVVLLLLTVIPIPTPSSTATPLGPTVALAMPAADPLAQTQVITITAGGVDPQVVTITAGTTVQWTNQDDISHTIMAGDGSFGPLSMPSQADIVTHTFTTGGDYPYYVAPLNVAGDVVVLDGAATPTGTAMPVDTASATSGPLDSVTPSTTPSTIPSDTPASTITPTDTPMPTDTATPSPTQTPESTATTLPSVSPTPSPSDTNTPPVTLTPPLNFPISLSGALTAVCMPTIPPGSIVTWSNDNPPGGPSYDLQGISSNFAFSDHIDPGVPASLSFANPGVYSYSISSNGQVLVANAQITVGADSIVACPSPTSTATASSTSTATATNTPTAVPTSIPAATTSPAPPSASIPTQTPLPTATATLTPLPTATATLTPRPTIPSAELRPPTTATPTPSPRRPATNHTGKPGHATHAAKMAPCPSAAWRRAGEIRVTAAGYLRRGRERVDLTLAVDARGGHPRGSLRLRDPGAHLLLTATRFTRLRWLCQGLTLDGVGRAGRRTLPIAVGMTRNGRVLSFSIAIPPLHYRLGGVAHGRAALLSEHAALYAAAKRHTRPAAQRGHARRKPAKVRPAAHK